MKDSLEPLKIKFINAWLQHQKNVFIDKLDGTVNKYITKLKSVDVKSSSYIDSSKEINDKLKLVNLIKLNLNW